MIHPTAFVHPTAIVEEDVEIGAGCAIWDHAHIRRGVRLGEECIVGEKTYIAYDARIGHRRLPSWHLPARVRNVRSTSAGRLLHPTS